MILFKIFKCMYSKCMRQAIMKQGRSIYTARKRDKRQAHASSDQGNHSNVHPNPLIIPQSGTRGGCTPAFLYHQGSTIRQKDQAQKTEIKTGPWDISNDNDSDVHEGSHLVQKGEHAGVDDVERTVGVALFDNAGDVDFACTCRGSR